MFLCDSVSRFVMLFAYYLVFLFDSPYSKGFVFDLQSDWLFERDSL